MKGESIMRLYYYEMPAWIQILCIGINLISIITLVYGCIYLYKQGANLIKYIIFIPVLLLNVLLYVLMILDTSLRQQVIVRFPLPVMLLVVIFLLSIFYMNDIMKKEKQKLIMINNTSIKEAFDLLPLGLCFFNETGLAILCNSAMYRFSSAVCGKDIQCISDIETMLEPSFEPMTGVKRDGELFILQNGSTWLLKKRQFMYKNKYLYNQFVAMDVSMLHEKRKELEQETIHLQKVQDELFKLSSNIIAITREEEILNTKMRVHDEMGRCLLLAQKYLTQEDLEYSLEDIAFSWKRAISMMKYHYDREEEDMLAQIKKTCDSLKIDYIQEGELPKHEKVAYMLTCAIRECVTNAVRYAKATELYVSFLENERFASVMICNNGDLPKKEIVEGGGLSTLRRKVESAGGRMCIQSFPTFQLTVEMPLNKEDLI